jgi:hypothetical protein
MAFGIPRVEGTTVSRGEGFRSQRTEFDEKISSLGGRIYSKLELKGKPLEGIVHDEGNSYEAFIHAIETKNQERISTLTTLLNFDEFTQEQYQEIIETAAESGLNDCLETFIPKLTEPQESLGRALEIVASQGFVDCVRTLIHHRLTPKESKGLALIEAAEEGNTECFILISRINEIDETCAGLALMEVAAKGDIECVQELLTNYTITPHYLRLAYEEAQREGHESCVELISSARAEEREAIRREQCSPTRFEKFISG